LANSLATPKSFSENEQESFEIGIASVIEETALQALRAKDHSSDFYDSDDVEKEQREAEKDIKIRSKITSKVIGEIFYHYQKKGIGLDESEINDRLLPHCWKESKKIYSDERKMNDAVEGYINDRDKK